MSGEHIFVATSTFSEEGPEPLAALKASGVPFALNPLKRRLKPEEIIAQAADATGIIAGVEPYTAEVLEHLPRLRVISRVGVGTDNIDKAAAASRSVVIRNTPEVVIQPVAELTIAMLFDLMRHLTQHTVEMRAHRWTKYTGSLVQGKTLGLIGLGRIGRRTAELATALGMKVIACDVAPDAAWAARAGVKLVSLDDVLAQSDVVSLHLVSDSTHPFLLDAEKIARMKPGARLINVARGSMVDETALSSALNSGHLAGAALDVFSEEPYVGPLRDCNNVVLTPHIATLTVETRVQMEREAVENLLAALGK